jgi:hypothetical protein
MAGAVSRQMSPGTSPASAHCPQLMVAPSESRARLTCAGGFERRISARTALAFSAQLGQM